MRRFILWISILMIYLASDSFAAERISKSLEILAPQEYAHTPQSQLHLDIRIFDSNSALSSKKKLVGKTTRISYENINGVLCHVGWYADGCIITALTGAEEGKQVMLHSSGVVLAVSYSFEVRSDCVVHRYNGCKVYSYKNKQEIKAK